ncbi:MAG: FMN-binding protein [Deltaproteobacteria bacterium]|nr:MAG: FMN-binding protein [Deltaproteobacteria bacterium]
MKKFILFLATNFLIHSLGAQTINIKPADVLKTIFQSSQEIVSEKHTLSADQKLILLKSLGTPVTKDEWTFYVAKTAGQVDGYAMIDHELGKMEPITFMTAFNKDGSVKAVEILVYREPYGSEVHEKKFVKQYEGKKNTDVLRVGQDIQNMTGATISSRSVTIGVKRDLAIWNIFYGKK